MTRKKEAIIIGLSNSKELAKKISNETKIELADVNIKKFCDGETIVWPEHPVRGEQVFLIQSTCKPVNDSLMELLIAIDALRRASASSIIAIIPYYGYSRQDRKVRGREPITSRLVADLIQTAGADRVLTLDIHSEQQQGFFSIPFDSLTAIWVLLKELFADVKYSLDDVVIVSPDYGGVKRARLIAEKLHTPIAIVDKRRPKPNEVEVENILGDIEGKHCILPDDMIDTGGTMINVSKLLKKRGAKSISIIATHGLFNGDSINNFNQAIKDKVIDNLYVSNSIETNIVPDGCKIVDISPILSNAINVYNSGIGSISTIYEKYQQFCKK